MNFTPIISDELDQQKFDGGSPEGSGSIASALWSKGPRFDPCPGNLRLTVSNISHLGLDVK